MQIIKLPYSNAIDYAPFGAQLAERSFNSENYPNSFNDKRDDPELGDWQDYGMRMYSPWQRRFPSPDPLIVYGQEYPWYSPYQFAGNKPIWAVDLDGLEEYKTSTGELIGKYGNSTEVRIVFDEKINVANYLIQNQKSPGSKTMNEKFYHSSTTSIFNNKDAAAVDFCSRVNSQSIKENKEVISNMYEINIEGESFYTYTRPAWGTEDNANPLQSPWPSGNKHTGILHTHGASSPEYFNNEFSGDVNMYVGASGDYPSFIHYNVDGYVGTPSGEVLKFDFERFLDNRVENSIQISIGIPSDPKDPDRVNNIDFSNVGTNNNIDIK